MSYHMSYHPRDFDFADRLVNMRKRASLTQAELALRIGVTTKAIRNWESGSCYPSDTHLQKLVELYLINRQVFTPGSEHEEIPALWDQLRERTHRHGHIFDKQWFTTLLQEWQAHQELSPQGGQPQAVVLERASRGASPARLLRGNWSEALDVSAVYGRSNQLAELERWLLNDQCRLVAVLGMGGIGKTTLAAKLVQQVAPHFERVLWRSLQNAPTLDELFLDWLPAISEQRLPPGSLDQSLALLLELLQERRCLLVLDNVETLFQAGVLEGRYREGYEGYATLIRCVAQTTHHSSLLLTCREQLPGLAAFTGRQAPVRVLRLAGLALVDSQQMLHDKGLFGDQEAWAELVERYAGNPLALKIVAETVHEIFSGDIAAFLLVEGLMVAVHGIHELLTQQFERLSALEQELMYWLAIGREPVTLEMLWEDLRRPVAKREVVEALQALRSRSLVERGEHGAAFTLQPVVLEYVTERLVALVSQEIRAGRPEMLLRQALLQGQRPDYIRSSQANLILKPVLDRLLSDFGSQEQLEAQFERLLEGLRAVPRTRQGYGGGNVVNLLVTLNGHIKGKDCSNLAIWQADLQEAEVHGTRFVGCDLTGSAFMETINGVTSVALSPNGQYVAGGSNSGEIHVWRAADGQLLLALPGHSRQVWSLAFHPAGRLLISGGYDGLVKVWDVSSGKCVSTLQGHARWVGSVALHPEGRLLATCSDDGSIRLWDLSTGRCIKVWYEQHRDIWSVAFSPDGRLLASGDVDGLVKVWELSSEQCLWSVVVHPGSAVPSLAFSPDGELLVSAGHDGVLTMWEAQSGAQLGTLSGHTDMVYSVTFNAEGLLASGGRGGQIRLWQIGDRGEGTRCSCTLHGHRGWIWSMVSGPGGLLASGSDDGIVKLWLLSRGGEGAKCLRTLRGSARLVNSVAFSPDGGILVSGERNGTIVLWETQHGQCLHTLTRKTGGAFAVAAVAFDPDGRRFATSSPENEITIWEVKSGQCLSTLHGHQGEIWSLAFSPDGQLLASGGSDGVVKLWETESGCCSCTLHGHRDWIWSLAFSPDGQLLASGGSDGVVKLWETESGCCSCTLQGSPKAQYISLKKQACYVTSRVEASFPPPLTVFSVK